MAIIIPIIAKFIDEGLDKAKNDIKSATGGIEKTSKAVNALAGPSKAIAVGLGGALFKVAKEAGAAGKANSKLAASFAATGYDKNAEAAMKYADSLQMVIGVSDEEIKATMQKLAAFDDVAASQDLMAKSTLAAANISAAGFGSMESAATALGKALSNPEKNLGALTRIGVTFTKQQEEQIKTMAASGDMMGAQAAIMETVEGKFSGIAEASASGTKKMKLQWGETAEILGESLVPWLVKLNAALTKAALFVADNAAALMKMSEVILKVTGGIVALNIAFKVLATVTKLVNGIIAVSKGIWAVLNSTFVKVAARLAVMIVQELAHAAAVKASAAATKAWGAASKFAAGGVKALGIAMKFLKGPIGIAIALIVSLTVIIVKNWDKIKDVTLKVWNWIKNFLVKTWEKIKSMCKAVWDGIVNIVKAAWEFVKRIIKMNPFIWAITHIDKIKGWFKAGFDWIKGKVKSVWDWLKGLFKVNPFAPIKNFLDSLKGWFGSAFDWIGDKIDWLSDAVSRMVDGVQAAFDSAKSIADKIPFVGSRSVGPSYTTPTIGPATTRSTSSSSGGGGVVINISGALDPEAVGRQVRRLLDSHDRRQGRAVVRAVAF
jgi:hypothetical protein